ncbi:hypothetical protein BAC1_00233 [uncultured bacterium]|nr:hypothetical protein BAC1_00233 [uncultured bacterium]
MIKKTRFLIICALILITGIYINLHADTSIPIKKPFKDFPLAHNGWSLVAESTFSDRILEVLKPSDYMSRRYKGPSGESIELYVGYYSGGKGSGGIHSPKQCLPGAGWFKVSEERTPVEPVPGKKFNIVKAVYEKGESREVFLYWYRVKGTEISDEYSLKLLEITNSMLHNRRDSAFIRISMASGDEGAAGEKAGYRFINDFYPVIEEFLPH